MKNLMLIMLVILMAGCASRQKDVQKNSAKFEFDKLIDTTAKFSTKVNLEKNAVAQADAASKYTLIEYEGMFGDSLEVVEYGSVGEQVSKTVIKGKGKTRIIKDESKSSSNATEFVDLDEDTKLEAHGQATIKAASDSVDKVKQVENSGFSFMGSVWIFLIILLIIIILVGRWYLNRYTKLLK